METIIEQCLESGWRLDPIPMGSVGYAALLPPEGDPRNYWCAQWEKYKYKDQIVLVPHWAAPGEYKEPK